MGHTLFVVFHTIILLAFVCTKLARYILGAAVGYPLHKPMCLRVISTCAVKRAVNTIFSRLLTQATPLAPICSNAHHSSGGHCYLWSFSCVVANDIRRSQSGFIDDRSVASSTEWFTVNTDT